MHDITLIFPPQWSPFQPALTISTLAGWLRNEGYRVGCIDANIDFYHYLLSDEAANILLEELKDNHGFDCQKKEAIRATISNIRHIRTSIHELLKGGESDNNKYLQNSYIATRILTSYLETISLLTKPVSISPFGMEMHSKSGFYVDELEKILSKKNSLLQRFVESFLDSPDVHNASIIGISCVGYSQLLMTLMMGKALKENTKKTVVVGGTVLYRLLDRTSIPSRWFTIYFDIVVKREGEIPCSAILNNNCAGKALTEDVPNIYFMESGNTVFNGEFSHDYRNISVDVDPDFSDIDFEKYFTSEVTLPILSYRGCYWGKCEFCTHSEVYGGKFNYVKTRQLLERIERLSNKYRVSNFCFNDEAMPPRLLRDIGRVFPTKKQSGWSFSGIMRFEESFSKEIFSNLYEKGFLVMYVGLESASERVLGLMNKTNFPSKDTIKKNLIAAADSGIFINCFTFFGFPGETHEDAKETYDFVINNSKHIGSFGTGSFLLEYGSPVFYNPDKHGVSIDVATKGCLSIWHKYSLSSGISSSDAEEWSKKLTIDAHKLESYASSVFSQREHLLPLLKRYGMSYEHETRKLYRLNGIPDMVEAKKVIAIIPLRNKETFDYYLINTANGATNKITEKTRTLIDRYLEVNPSLYGISLLGERWGKLVRMQSLKCDI
ncbi:MAG: B12-binding domain-containing radical SAM protein [Candidatus Electrothrix sp. YB6]